MALAIIHATSPKAPIPCYLYEFGELSEDVMNDNDLSEEVRAVRHKLHKENKERIIDKEREGHYENSLICTLLDPRGAYMQRASDRGLGVNSRLPRKL